MNARTALWFPQWFDTLADANTASGFNGRTWLAIPLRKLLPCPFTLLSTTE